MAMYELDLDDVQATRLIKLLELTSRAGGLNAGEAALAVTVAGLIREQVPQPEPSRQYLVKDKDGDVWRWNERQSAWHCVTHNSGAEPYTQWSTLVSQYSPVTLYAEIPG